MFFLQTLTVIWSWLFHVKVKYVRSVNTCGRSVCWRTFVSLNYVQFVVLRFCVVFFFWLNQSMNFPPSLCLPVSLAEVDGGTVTKCNFAGDEKAGASWTEKILANKTEGASSQMPGGEGEGAEEDEWVRRTPSKSHPRWNTGANKTYLIYSYSGAGMRPASWK